MTMRTLISSFLLALLAAPALAATGEPAPGIAGKKTMAPVTATALRAGAVLTEGDLVPGAVADAQLRAGIVTRSEDLVGKQVKRSLSAGQPIRLFDVKEPDLVRKGELVSLTLERNGLTIAVVGRALESGPRDAVVRVQNVASKLVVQGSVSGQSAVSVQSLLAPKLAAR